MFNGFLLCAVMMTAIAGVSAARGQDRPRRLDGDRFTVIYRYRTVGNNDPALAAADYKMASRSVTAMEAAGHIDRSQGQQILTAELSLKKTPREPMSGKVTLSYRDGRLLYVLATSPGGQRHSEVVLYDGGTTFEYDCVNHDLEIRPGFGFVEMAPFPISSLDLPYLAARPRSPRAVPGPTKTTRTAWYDFPQIGVVMNGRSPVVAPAEVQLIGAGKAARPISAAIRHRDGVLFQSWSYGSYHKVDGSYWPGVITFADYAPEGLLAPVGGRALRRETDTFRLVSASAAPLPAASFDIRQWLHPADTVNDYRRNPHVGYTYYPTAGSLAQQARVRRLIDSGAIRAATETRSNNLVPSGLFLLAAFCMVGLAALWRGVKLRAKR